VALLGDPVGHDRQVADGIADVVETARSGNFAGLSQGHTRILTAESVHPAEK
jgi:hypothetical protein